MAKGAILKGEITEKILKNFEGSFLYNNGKEIRICGEEDGSPIQIKVTLTCAKENVTPGDDNAIPGTTEKLNEINFEEKPVQKKEIEHIEPTAEEKANVSELLRSLGL